MKNTTLILKRSLFFDGEMANKCCIETDLILHDELSILEV